MPLIDLPVAELFTYQGKSPCPADFDQFWDAALAEMHAVKPHLELRPASLQTAFAECFDGYFTGVGGARIHALIARPRREQDRLGPAVVTFHGYSGDAGDWLDKLAYVAAGYTIAALDCRGQGGASEDSVPVLGMTLRGHIVRGLDSDPQKLMFRNVFLDCAQLTEIVMTQPGVERSRVGVYGGSQGGGLSLACAALVPEVARAAVAFPFLSDYRRVWEMDLAKDAYDDLRYYFRTQDPRHLREEEIFHKLGYIDIQNLAKRIRARVQMQTGLMDTICPPSTQFAAYNKITSPKEVLFYPDFGHEFLKGANDIMFKFLLEL